MIAYLLLCAAGFAGFATDTDGHQPSPTHTSCFIAIMIIPEPEPP